MPRIGDGKGIQKTDVAPQLGGVYHRQGGRIQAVPPKTGAVLAVLPQGGIQELVIDVPVRPVHHPVVFRLAQGGFKDRL